MNKVEALVQGGCKAFAEDTRTVYDESAQFMSEGGVAVVVVTPKFARNDPLANRPSGLYFPLLISSRSVL